MRMVRLPEGGRIQVELDPEQVEVYVRAAIDREVRAYVEKSLPTYAVRDMMRGILRDRVDQILRTGLEPDDRIHDRVALAVGKWLDAREGWVARVVRKGTSL
jgi:hypothetical protein